MVLTIFAVSKGKLLLMVFLFFANPHHSDFDLQNQGDTNLGSILSQPPNFEGIQTQDFSLCPHLHVKCERKDTLLSCGKSGNKLGPHAGSAIVLKIPKQILTSIFRPVWWKIKFNAVDLWKTRRKNAFAKTSNCICGRM